LIVLGWSLPLAVEQHCMANGETNRNTQRSRALGRRSTRSGRQRERRDPHQVIGAQAMEKAERQRRNQQQH
jgi:hypothetical protein